MPELNLVRATGRIVLLAAALAAACGGGGDSALPPAPGVACSTLDERVWLAERFDQDYFWYRLAPGPSPFADRPLAEFFQASLYTGSDPSFPRDRWSRMERQSDFERFFSEGRTLGYGLFLAGIEVAGQPDRPLRVRYVEPQSDAAAQGLRRGDEVVSANGRPAAQIVAANDFSAFSPDRDGQTLSLLLRRDGAERSLTLTATSFALTPVGAQGVVQSPAGRRVGYLLVKDMIDQAGDPLAAAFADFKAAGVQDLVIDLRYNGGGLVSVARQIASYVTGSRAEGMAFARLVYNDRRARRDDDTFQFENPRSALGLTRVYLLTGPRTCSASELVINGLRPFVEVVTVGDTTCGKPVGFVPKSRCNTTFSIVNFESVNARNEGRWFNGFDASCAVAENLSQPLGAADEALLDAARRHADSGRCPAPAGLSTSRRQALQGLDRLGREPAERQGMWSR